MMSDLVKAQNTPQFNWYTCLTPLGADGTPDKLIEKGLKPPDQIKISVKKNSKDLNFKEITGQVVPNQALFGAEYFLAYSVHAAQFQVEDLDLIIGCAKGRWSNAIQPHGSMLSRRRPD